MIDLCLDVLNNMGARIPSDDDPYADRYPTRDDIINDINESVFPYEEWSSMTILDMVAHLRNFAFCLHENSQCGQILKKSHLSLGCLLSYDVFITL